MVVSLGADTLSQELQGLFPIHYAIEYKQLEAFKVLLDLALSSEYYFDTVNADQVDKTLASYCVINQAWHCLSYLIQRCSLAILKSKPKLGVN
jgi:hypothetical protein